MTGFRVAHVHGEVNAFMVPRSRPVQKTSAYAHVSQTSQAFSFERWCPINLYLKIAFEAPCSCTHCGITSVHGGDLHPSLNQYWKTCVFEYWQVVRYAVHAKHSESGFVGIGGAEECTEWKVAVLDNSSLCSLVHSNEEDVKRSSLVERAAYMSMVIEIPSIAPSFQPIMR